MKKTLPSRSFVFKKNRTEPELQNVKSVKPSPGSDNLDLSHAGKLRAPIPKVR